MYKFYKLRPEQDEPETIVRLLDNAFIPTDPINTDYQLYLLWVAEGNIAEEWNPE